MNYDILVNNKLFKGHVDQILKSTEPTSSEAIDLEQVRELANSFDFPSPSDEHHSSPVTSAHYSPRDYQPSDRLSYN